jgi:hypothetical protein
MRKLLALTLGLMLSAFVLTTSLSAQTIGGDTALTSKTWTWTGLTGSFPSTVLFTPATTSDFVVSVYVSGSVSPDGGGMLCPQLQWTDEYSTYAFPDLDSGTGLAYVGCGGIDSLSNIIPGVMSIPIHAVADTPVSISVINSTGGPTTVTYNLIVAKVKTNP